MSNARWLNFEHMILQQKFTEQKSISTFIDTCVMSDWAYTLFPCCQYTVMGSPRLLFALVWQVWLIWRWKSLFSLFAEIILLFPKIIASNMSLSFLRKSDFSFYFILTTGHMRLQSIGWCPSKQRIIKCN